MDLLNKILNSCSELKRVDIFLCYNEYSDMLRLLEKNNLKIQKYYYKKTGNVKNKFSVFYNGVLFIFKHGKDHI